MNGMDARTGKPLAGTAHLEQSIGDLFRTRIGSRVCRRDYGSLIPDLIDSAMNAGGRLRLYAGAATAIARWEPRLRLDQVTIEPGAEAGAYVLTLTGRRTDVPAAIAAARLSIPLAASA